MANGEINPKTFLKQGFHYVVADFLYTNFFQPVLSFFERMSRRGTERWCRDRIPANEQVK